jgi:hypothetical protein
MAAPVEEPSGDPDAARHVDIHRHLAEKAMRLLAGFKARTSDAGQLFQFLAHDVIAGHMLGEDRAFFPLFADPAPGGAPEAGIAAVSAAAYR